MLVSAISARAFPLHQRVRQVRILVTVMLALTAAAAGCGPPDHPPQAGQLSVTFTPRPPALANLMLASGALSLDHILVLGDAPPPMHPPMMPPLDLDVLGSGASITLTMLPPGVYSRVQLSFEDVLIQGTWRGTPFQVRIAAFRPAPVDMRSPTGKELAHGQDVAFAVTIDANAWFAGGLLDSATPSPGNQILIDDQNNVMIASALMMRIAQSFSLQ
jgi:hypothetical protein